MSVSIDYGEFINPPSPFVTGDLRDFGTNQIFEEDIPQKFLWQIHRADLKLDYKLLIAQDNGTHPGSTSTLAGMYMFLERT
jgi:hypothetical protein